MTKIRKDIHGKYIEHNNNIYRPIYPLEYDSAGYGQIDFDINEIISITSWEGCPFIVVTSKDYPDKTDVWFMHGSILQKRGTRVRKISPKKVYKPSHHRWND